MAKRCIALLSGGLDSLLAIRIMQKQGIEVEALTFKTLFECCDRQASLAARELGVRLTVVEQEDDYLEVIRRPRFGRGRGANPCVDCRIYMFQRAKQALGHLNAQFVVSGEVIGQRPMSQKRRDLAVIARHSGLEDLLLRPLCAKLQPITRPEREGWVDRDKLYSFSGRSRKGLTKLARELGLARIPSPSTGCALTERQFSRNVFDLMQHKPDANRWDFELLKVGRHFRFDDATKIVVGRNKSENDALLFAHGLPEATSAAVLMPENFVGPLAVVVGPPTDAAIRFAGGLVLRHSKYADRADAQVRVITADGERVVGVNLFHAVQTARTLASAQD